MGNLLVLTYFRSQLHLVTALIQILNFWT